MLKWLRGNYRCHIYFICSRNLRYISIYLCHLRNSRCYWWHSWWNSWSKDLSKIRKWTISLSDPIKCSSNYIDNWLNLILATVLGTYRYRNLLCSSVECYNSFVTPIHYPKPFTGKSKQCLSLFCLGQFANWNFNWRGVSRSCSANWRSRVCTAPAISFSDSSWPAAIFLCRSQINHSKDRGSPSRCQITLTPKRGCGGPIRQGRI